MPASRRYRRHSYEPGAIDDAACDLEWLRQPLADGHRVELDTIAAAETPVDGRPEHPITFPAPGQIGREGRLELEEHLLDRAVRQARAEVRSDIPQLDGGARHEADRRIEVAADPFVGHRDVQEVVRIVHFEAVRGRVAAEILASRGEAPRPDEQVLVAAET